MQVIEERSELICPEKNDENNETNEYENDTNEIEENEVDTNNEIESESSEESDAYQSPLKENLNVVRKSNRKRSPVNLYGNPVSHYIYINCVNANVPNTFEEAINGQEKNEWKLAINAEMESLAKNKTWQIAERPTNKRVVDVKRVYKRKSDGKFKARLVARGFQQREQIDNVYSPVGKMGTLKMLLAYCCKHGLLINQMDVETALLNGELKSEVCVNEPKGYTTGKNKVYKLQRALYGLRESPARGMNVYMNI